MTDHHTPQIQDPDKITEVDTRSKDRGGRGVPAAYPKRPKLFALKFIKWLHDSGNAQEIGPTAVALLTAVVTKEDDILYRRAVMFWNEQLAERCGIKSIHALDAARKRAIDAGLLCYKAGTNHVQGRYFVIWPDSQDAIETGLNQEVRVRQTRSKPERNRIEPRSSSAPNAFETGAKPERDRSETGTSVPTTLIPNNPNPNSLSDHSIGGLTKITSGAIPVDPGEVVSAWNKISGVKPILKLTNERRRKLTTRLHDPEWPWKEAFARLPLPPGEWQPDFDWILKNSTNAFAIVEGKYDFRAKLNNKGPNHDSRNDTGRPRGSLFER